MAARKSTTASVPTSPRWARRWEAAIRSARWQDARTSWTWCARTAWASRRSVWAPATLGGTRVRAPAAPAPPAGLPRPGPSARLFALGESLRSGLRAALKAAGVAAHVQGDGPLAAVVFTDREVVDYRS